MSRPTLAKLATLAEEHLDGFKRPRVPCVRCEGRGTNIPTAIPSSVVCADCSGYGTRFDCPEDLISTVVLYCYEKGIGHGFRGGQIEIAAYVEIDHRKYFAHVGDTRAESIARAMLIALLFAHGIKP